MTKSEKLEKAMKDHQYAIERIAELEKEISNMRFRLKSKQHQLDIATGKRPEPEAYPHHY